MMAERRTQHAGYGHSLPPSPHPIAFSHRDTPPASASRIGHLDFSEGRGKAGRAKRQPFLLMQMHRSSEFHDTFSSISTHRDPAHDIQRVHPSNPIPAVRKSEVHPFLRLHRSCSRLPPTFLCPRPDQSTNQVQLSTAVLGNHAMESVTPPGEPV